jgi:hypothetical protein
MSTIRYRRIMPALFSPSKVISKTWIKYKREENHELDWWVDACEPTVEIDESTAISQGYATLVFTDSETNEIFERMYIYRKFNVGGWVAKYVEAAELENELATVFLDPEGHTVQAYSINESIIQPHPYCTV